MKKYLLLRNNKQSGPYSYEELMEMGLKAHDLLWVDGKSAAWRYPMEFDEFKINPAVEKDTLTDRTFTNLQNDLLIYMPENVNPVHVFPDDELIEFPTMARFMENEEESSREKIISTSIIPIESGISEPPAQELIPMMLNEVATEVDLNVVATEFNLNEDAKDVDLNEDAKDVDLNQVAEMPALATSGIEINQVEEIKTEIPAEVKKDNQSTYKGRVSVTLPAAARDNTRVVIHPKDIPQRLAPAAEILSEPLPDLQELIQTVSPIVSAETSEPTSKEIRDIPMMEVEKMQINIPEMSVLEQDPVIELSPVETDVPVTAPEKSESSFPARMVVKIRKENEITERKTEPAPIVPLMPSSPSSPLIQKIAVAAAIISLLGVAGLIANSILNPDAYNYTIVKSNPEATVPDTKTTAASSEVSVNQNTALNQSAPAAVEPISSNALPADNKQPLTKSLSNKKGKAVQETAPVDSETVQPIQKEASTVAFTKQEIVNVVDPKEETRKNISNLVTYSMNNFKVNTFGGVSDFEVTLTNGSSYPLDLVVVELKYIQSNKKVFKTERLEFKGIAPKGKQTIGVPKSNRGIKVESSITSITSHDLDLTYQNK